jgi:hypothetical protein
MVCLEVGVCPEAIRFGFDSVIENHLHLTNVSFSATLSN